MGFFNGCNKPQTIATLRSISRENQQFCQPNSQNQPLLSICALTVLCLILLPYYNQDARGRTNAGRGRRGRNLCLPS
ncbi:hypothetical protein CEXT_140811 [Caerostris extrusa]|uniref:Uncharacterized protein n=1 Tax=Caerostris extrusa TaxID=172846 RepID=A0AAV4Q8J3_CAEEX|nr:hypothetical protein CEXT_140811 [Caerostris extrusa]